MTVVTQKKIRNVLLCEYNGSEREPNVFWLPTFLKISSFVFCGLKKVIKIWNDTRMSK